MTSRSARGRVVPGAGRAATRRAVLGLGGSPGARWSVGDNSRDSTRGEKILTLLNVHHYIRFKTFM